MGGTEIVQLELLAMMWYREEQRERRSLNPELGVDTYSERKELNYVITQRRELIVAQG